MKNKVKTMPIDKIKITAKVEMIYSIERFKKGEIELRKQEFQDECIGRCLVLDSLKVNRI